MLEESLLLMGVRWLNEIPREKVPERLKGIFARSGRSTGAEAQI